MFSNVGTNSSGCFFQMHFHTLSVHNICPFNWISSLFVFIRYHKHSQIPILVTDCIFQSENIFARWQLSMQCNCLFRSTFFYGNRHISICRGKTKFHFIHLWIRCVIDAQISLVSSTLLPYSSVYSGEGRCCCSHLISMCYLSFSLNITWIANFSDI